VNLRQLPNAITVARMLAVPPLMWLLVHERYPAAWWVALLAGLSDALDGLLAKRFGWFTPLGGLLDPIADKLLLAAGFVGLWLGGHLPGWLMSLVLARDAVIVAGAIAWHLSIGPITAAPSRLSKANTAIQIAFVLWLLGGLAFAQVPVAGQWLGAWLVAAFTLASGVDYVVRWSVMARAAHQEMRK
jgi:cardiolipin synthase